ncbi:ABC-F family ATP-binding cassette domain-containing protein [Corynebacterium glyciniphilum]|uniref:ABC-F family ATP-binding cassette domain-containing protein n=1 Tax=Corynebacterium glyciniphilum TaxID=1404244 RepID=UPI0026567F43|nr:ATP-binding cassette domain-containing protein [Corynebacterium glyciniphilum]MDN5682750.1 ATP-binding cassette domain-containing protein [Corynebacterium glyciniphilum]
MSVSHQPSVVLTDVSFSWPDGTAALDRISAAFGTGRTGLVGANGTGKSTLLKLITGELTPVAGTVTTKGAVDYLALTTEVTVSDLLGVTDTLDALRAIEAGSVETRHFDALDEAWDCEAQARAALDDVGLATVDLDRTVGTLAGGETVLTAVAGLRLRSNRSDGVVLLDEPTNNLDRRARHDLYDALTTWPGALIVVSHDVTLLDLMDDTAEQTLRTEKRQQADAQTKLARRQRYARTDFVNKRKPKMIMNQRKTEAQVSAGKLRGELDEKVAAAQREKQRQEERLRHESVIRITLPDPGVPAGRRLLEFRDDRGTSVVLQGSERLALTGPNGVGKTRLLEALVRQARDDDGSTATQHGVRASTFTERIGYLPQRLDHLDDEATVIDTVRTAAPNAPVEQVRASLARFLFGEDTVHRRVGDLSGGERFRVALARILLAEPAHQLLVLDEPTNNLDLDSVDALVSALEDYHGGLIVVSHDDAFLGRMGIDTWMELQHGVLRRVGL